MINHDSLARATTRELVHAVQTGHQSALDAETLLHQANDGLCRAVVRHLRPLEATPDPDLLQEAHVGLHHAMRSYRPEFGASFSTFAWRVMSRTVTKAIVRVERLRATISIETAAGSADASDEGGVGGVTIADIENAARRTAPGAFDEAAAIRETVRRLPLSQRAREILWRLYWRNETQTEIAQHLGISHTAVQKHRNRTLATLRHALTA